VKLSLLSSRKALVKDYLHNFQNPKIDFQLAKVKSFVLDTPAIFFFPSFSQTAPKDPRGPRVGKKIRMWLIHSAGLPDTRIVKPYLKQPKAIAGRGDATPESRGRKTKGENNYYGNKQKKEESFMAHEHSFAHRTRRSGLLWPCVFRVWRGIYGKSRPVRVSSPRCVADRGCLVQYTTAVMELKESQHHRR
jgi:hypothetical protein